MYNFGKIPPRAIQASGVASVLGESCRVFYDSLFNAAGLGRVSDLLSSKLREHGLDELKLEAYRAQSDEQGLNEPLVIECGVDEEKVAVGFAFSHRHLSEWDVGGLSERLSKNQPLNAFETLLSMIYANSDHALLRVDLVGGRVEVISLLAIPGQMETSEKQPITVIELKAEESSSSKASEYVQLGDLDFNGLLKPTFEKKKREAKPSTGEVLTQVDPTPKEEEQTVRLSGDSNQNGTDVIRISGGSNAEPQNEVVRIAAGKTDANGNKLLDGFSVQAMLNKVWPFNRKKKEDEQAPGSAQPEPNAAPAQNDWSVTPAAEALPQFEEGDAKGMVQYLSSSVTSGSFSKLFEQSQEMLREIKRNPNSNEQSIKQWVEGFTQQIHGEKVRFAQLSQKLAQAVRQREGDLKQREQRFVEDLRRRDEALHQKAAALTRSKEEIAQLHVQIGKLKSTKGPSSEEAGFKQKYEMTQRLLNNLRDEKAKLVARMDELKNQQSTIQKASDTSAQTELSSLKVKHEQIVRQNMQLKSMNEQLMRRMGQSMAKSSEKSDRNSSAVEEMKKKFEAATKIAEKQQKDIAQLKERVNKYTKEESLKATELAKKDAELKKMKADLELLQRSLSQSKKAG
jgi:hypothetical protein